MKISIKHKSLEEIQNILEDALSLVSHTLKMYTDIIETGGTLTTIQERTLTSFITCLYQTNKDYRATLRELEREVAALTPEEKRALAGIESDELSQTTIRNIIKN